jgi:hypothetical protein
VSFFEEKNKIVALGRLFNKTAPESAISMSQTKTLISQKNANFLVAGWTPQQVLGDNHDEI